MDKKKVVVRMYVSVFQSSRGNKTFALIADLGYTKKYLSFDTQTLAELLGIPVVELYSKEYGEYEVI